MTKIISWNVNSIRVRLNHVVHWLQEHQPDIVLFQELKCEDHAFPAQPYEDLGYNITLHGQKTYNGVAILSKFPLEDIVKGIPENNQDLQARYIEAVTGGLRVASVYVPNGMEIGSEKFNYKTIFFEKLRSYMTSLWKFDEPYLVGGDFNVAPYLCDGYNPQAFREGRILCSQDERDALRRILNIGYVDALRLLNPEDHHMFTWWDYRAGAWEANRGYRIDHFLLNSYAADQLASAGVDSAPRGLDRASDHAPIWIVLNRQN